MIESQFAEAAKEFGVICAGVGGSAIASGILLGIYWKGILPLAKKLLVDPSPRKEKPFIQTLGL